MIPIKKNYNDFLKQIELLAEKILTCTDENKTYIYLKAYKALIYLYSLNKKRAIYVEEIEKNAYYKDLDKRKTKEELDLADNFFLEEKSALRDIIYKDLFYDVNLLDTFSNSSFYQKNYKLYNKKFNSEELYDILVNFLKTENKEMLSILEELIEEKRFYYLKDKRNIKANALTLFNPIDKKNNILIRKNLVTLNFLEAYIHEIAHVFDARELVAKTDEFETAIYSSRSVLNETISTFYSLDLYEYLLKNSLYKENAIVGLFNTLTAYTLTMDSAYLLCTLEKDEFVQVKDTFPTKGTLLKIIQEKNSDMVNDNISPKYLKEEIDISETLQYAYGYLLSKTLLKDKSNLAKFLRIRNNFLIEKELHKEGFDLSADPKILTKHLEEYLD